MLTVGVTFLLARAAAAATVGTTGVTACSLSGWSNDNDPAGLNIRAAPRADAEIIGRVPQPRKAGATECRSRKRPNSRWEAAREFGESGR